MSGTARILVADRQESVRSGFRLVLDAQPDMRVVGEAGTGRRAVDLTRHLRPDVVLADLDLPDVDGRQLTRALAGADAVRVIVTATSDPGEDAPEALRRGASGFLLKPCGPALLVEAVRAAMSGGILVSPSITGRLVRRLPAPTGHRRRTGRAAALTDREVDVARAVAAGKTNGEIAAELYITAGTVKTHLAHIQAKLGVRNRVGVAAWAWAHGHAAPA